MTNLLDRPLHLLIRLRMLKHEKQLTVTPKMVEVNKAFQTLEMNEVPVYMIQSSSRDSQSIWRHGWRGVLAISIMVGFAFERKQQPWLGKSVNNHKDACVTIRVGQFCAVIYSQVWPWMGWEWTEDWACHLEIWCGLHEVAQSKRPLHEPSHITSNVGQPKAVF